MFCGLNVQISLLFFLGWGGGGGWVEVSFFLPLRLDLLWGYVFLIQSALGLLFYTQSRRIFKQTIYLLQVLKRRTHGMLLSNPPRAKASTELPSLNVVHFTIVSPALFHHTVCIKSGISYRSDTFRCLRTPPSGNPVCHCLAETSSDTCTCQQMHVSSDTCAMCDVRCAMCSLDVRPDFTICVRSYSGYFGLKRLTNSAVRTAYSTRVFE